MGWRVRGKDIGAWWARLGLNDLVHMIIGCIRLCVDSCRGVIVRLSETQDRFCWSVVLYRGLVIKVRYVFLIQTKDSIG